MRQCRMGSYCYTCAMLQYRHGQSEIFACFHHFLSFVFFHIALTLYHKRADIVAYRERCILFVHGTIIPYSRTLVNVTGDVFPF